jgi:hypothetical protein
MSGPESFDAFYARTVPGVTAAIHDLAGGDPQADHAIREAYALVYQQWYEVSGYRDPDAWVMDAARQAYERRRDAPPAPDTDSGTWPNMYRQPAPARTAGEVQPPLGEPTSAMAGVGAHGMAVPGSPTHAMPGGPPWPGHQNSANGVTPGRACQGRAGSGPRSGGLTVANRQLAAIVAVVAVLAAGVITYLAVGRGSAPTTSGGTPNPAAGPGKPTATMLRAGQQGTRSAVPWSLVRLGWTLAEVSTGQPGAGGPAGGISSTFLVDPLGGRYLMYQWQAGSDPQLLAWSGDKKNALLAMASGGYRLLTLKTGQAAPLNLPAGVLPAGFTLPDGLNILAVHVGSDGYKLQRYNLVGEFQATLAHMPLRADQPQPQGSCMSGDCAALSSPGGDMAVWGTRGDPMQLVSNSGKGPIQKLHVPGSDSCTPISWWDSATVLATCVAGKPQLGQTELWLVPDDGRKPTPLTTQAGSVSGAGTFTGAWQAGQHLYATATTSQQCAGAASGPGGLGIIDVTDSTSPAPVTISGTTNTYAAVVAVDQAHGRLLVLARTSCPGSWSLLWFTPSSGTTQTLLAAPARQAGVIAAVPYHGSGPAAIAG